MSRQNSSSSHDFSASQNPENQNSNDPVSDNCQISFIENLVEIGRKLVPQPDRDSKTQRLVSELNELNLHLPDRVWVPIAEDTNHFVVRITPSAAVVLNSKDKAPYFAYMEVLTTSDRVTDDLPQKMLEASLIDEAQGTLIERELFSDEENDLNDTITPTQNTHARRDSTHTNSDESSSENQINPNSMAADVVSLSRISIRSLDSHQSFDTASIISASEIRARLDACTSGKHSNFQHDPLDPSAAALKEPFAEKERKIREASPYGHLPNWRLLPVIIKCGDDLRQEMLAYQLLCALQDAWSREQTKIWIRPYRILVTGPDSGMIEPILNAPSIHQIKKMEPGGLKSYFEKEFGGKTSEGGIEAMMNFVRSCAGYSLVCYLLQVKDRHNGNILLDSQGHIVHIDFGFMLSSSPGKNLGFETSPFKLTEDMVELMDGMESDMFNYYKSLLLQGLRAAAKHMERIVSLVEVAQCGPHLP